MVFTLRASLSKLEVAFIRVPFSILAGWLTAATILNSCIMLDCVIEADDQVQSNFCCVMIYIAWIVYVIATFTQKDPLYGAIWLWTLTAIKSR
jgi:hypothetical protein